LKIPNKTFPITHMRDESRTRIERLGGNLYQCYNQLLEEVEKVKESPLELFLP
jgi:predicted hydrolase (HD superfamily)